MYKLPAQINMGGIVQVNEISNVGTLQVYCSSWQNFSWKQATGSSFFASATTDDVGKHIFISNFIPTFFLDWYFLASGWSVQYVVQSIGTKFSPIPGTQIYLVTLQINSGAVQTLPVLLQQETSYILYRLSGFKQDTGIITIVEENVNIQVNANSIPSLTVTLSLSNVG